MDSDLMISATSDNICITLTAAGNSYLATGKVMPVNRVGLSESGIVPSNDMTALVGFIHFVDAEAYKNNKVISLTFNADFIGDFSVNQIGLYQDETLLGIISHQVDNALQPIFTMTAGLAYVVGASFDLAKQLNTITINRYKSNKTKVSQNLCSPKPLPPVKCEGQDEKIQSIVKEILTQVDEKQIPDLISSDTPNELKLGSDEKLLSQPPDTNFLAYYLLAKG